MSRILFLSQLLPYPPDAGPKVRSYYVLRHLARQHAVTLLAFTRPDDRPEAVVHLREFCTDVRTVPMIRSRVRDAKALAASFLTAHPFVIRRDAVAAMHDLLQTELQNTKFDYIHADQLWMAQYALAAKRSALQPSTFNLQLVLDEHNACFQISQRLARGERSPLMRMLLEREWRVLQRYEARACAQFDHIVTVTENDRAVLEPLAASELKVRNSQSEILSPKFSTIPICVDTQAVMPVSPRSGAKDVLHLGTMFWLPNVEGVLWFAREVWPKVVAQVPQATFTIAGKNPPAEIQALAASQNGSSSVQVTGYVPDPQPYLERAGVFIVPLLSGGGMRVKIVDAWRWGLPVVSTSIGAEGISCRDGENILIADGIMAFTQAVVRVLCDPALAQRLRENGRRWVEAHYEWRSVYSQWDSIYST